MMTLPEALYAGYRRTRYAHPDDLVTPAAILHEIRGIGQYVSETWPYRNWSVGLIRHAIWMTDVLILAECDFVRERPTYPGTNIPDRRPEGKIMWGGRRND